MSIIQELSSTTQALATPGKGILAADESTPTITSRFEALNISCTEDARLAYRELLFTATNINRYIAGVILFEETLYQTSSAGQAIPQLLKQNNILAGIKVDKGLTRLANSNDEKVTQGLDGLDERIKKYKEQGASFAKWRAVYAISKANQTPTKLAIKTNAEVLARYAAICQENGIVPIVEPEVLIDGEYDISQAEIVGEAVLRAVFKALNRHKVQLEYIVLKPSMIVAGKNTQQKPSIIEVAETTIRVLKRSVPAAVPTINFLSGGQSSEDATAHLNAMNQLAPLPWNVSFSYARALQDYAMKAWLGDAANKDKAQLAFLKRAKLNSLAAIGEYHTNMESEDISLVA